MPKCRFEEPFGVEIEIDTNGWPMVTVFPREGPVEHLIVRPEGHATWVVAAQKLSEEQRK